MTSYDAGAGLRFWGFEPPILAVVPATLPLSYALNLKSLAWRVFDIQVSYPLSCVEAPEWGLHTLIIDKYIINIKIQNEYL